MQNLRQLVASTKLFPLPDYDVELIAGQHEPLLLMRYRGEGTSKSAVGAAAPLGLV